VFAVTSQHVACARPSAIGARVWDMDEQPRNGDEPADNLSPFERFERLTKRIVSAPKAEVDALRKREAAERARAAALKRAKT
jgi:hypothetical protein